MGLRTGIVASRLKRYLPDLPSTAYVVVVPSPIPKQRISFQVATQPPPRGPRPKVRRVVETKKIVKTNKWGMLEVYDRPVHREVIEYREPGMPKNDQRFPAEQTNIVTDEHKADEQFVQNTAARIKSGLYPTIILGKEGASVYPHPNIVVEEKEKSYHSSKFLIHISVPEMTAASSQFQMHQTKDFYREVMIYKSAIESNDVILLEDLSPTKKKPTSKRFPGLDLDALPPEERVKLLVTD